MGKGLSLDEGTCGQTGVDHPFSRLPGRALAQDSVTLCRLFTKGMSTSPEPDRELECDRLDVSGLGGKEETFTWRVSRLPQLWAERL